MSSFDTNTIIADEYQFGVLYANQLFNACAILLLILLKNVNVDAMHVW